MESKSIIGASGNRSASSAIPKLGEWLQQIPGITSEISYCAILWTYIDIYIHIHICCQSYHNYRPIHTKQNANHREIIGRSYTYMVTASSLCCCISHKFKHTWCIHIFVCTSGFFGDISLQSCVLFKCLYTVCCILFQHLLLGYIICVFL